MTNLIIKAFDYLAARSARPDWTLAAFASIMAAGITAILRYALGSAPGA
jgi:hypothetical protein